MDPMDRLVHSMEGGICARDAYVLGMLTLSLQAPAAHKLGRCVALPSCEANKKRTQAFRPGSVVDPAHILGVY